MNDNEKATFTSFIICSFWFSATVWYLIQQRIEMEEKPGQASMEFWPNSVQLKLSPLIPCLELMGPLYTVAYGMYLFVDFLILSKCIVFAA